MLLNVRILDCNGSYGTVCARFDQWIKRKLLHLVQVYVFNFNSVCLYVFFFLLFSVLVECFFSSNMWLNFFVSSIEIPIHLRSENREKERERNWQFATINSLKYDLYFNIKSSPTYVNFRWFVVILRFSVIIIRWESVTIRFALKMANGK